MIGSQRQVDQQNIMLNNSSMISPTSDEEMRHASKKCYKSKQFKWLMITNIIDC